MTLEDSFSTGPPQSAGATSTGGANPDGGFDSGAQPPSGGTAGNPSVAGAGATISGGDASFGGTGEGGDPGLAGAGGVADPPPCATCLPSECCDGQCVDLRYDPKNCRACGDRCPGTTCDNSSCTNTCAQGFIDCNRNVVDGCEVNPAIDEQNCGNCLIVCGFQLECVDGNCVCPVGTADCDGIKENGCETDTSSDAASCGGCGKACSEHQSCLAGVCGCATGFSDCNQLLDDGCEAALTADGSCGSCSIDCGPHGKCLAPGQCGCAPGFLDCDALAPGCEAAITEPNHCGACDAACPVATPACDGTACSLGCGGLTACGASCVNIQQDPQNCGGCGKPVGLNQVCAAGHAVCVSNYADCDSNANDCEVSTQTDADHCGACEAACKSGAVCAGGVCACGPTTPNDCGASCEQCCNDSQCSDGDSCTADTCSAGVCDSDAPCAGGGSCCAGTGCFECCSDADCATDQVCSGNQCGSLVCTLPQIACKLQCVNPTTDSANCGGCGNDCGIGRSCAGAACTPRWVAMLAPPGSFVAREKSAHSAMGSKVFIWGGSTAAQADLNDGAVYDPALDAWSAVSAGGTPPSARVLATAVWTGSVVVVWGGGNAAGTADFSSGGRYDPVSGTWQAMATLGAPAGRRGSFAFWTGSRVLVYGGVDRFGTPSPALGLYDPVNDVWSQASTIGQPSARTHPTVGFSGSLLVIYGGLVNGNNANDRQYTYDVAANTWRQGNGPSARYGAFGTWEGTYVVVWSGASPQLKSDGELYDPNANIWSKMTNMGSPQPRWAPRRQTGWSARVKPGVTLMVGGLGAMANMFFRDGGLYNSTTNSWTPIAAWPSGASHFWGVGVWTGSELVVWGGRTGTASALTTAGERYLP